MHRLSWHTALTERCQIWHLSVHNPVLLQKHLFQSYRKPSQLPVQNIKTVFSFPFSSLLLAAFSRYLDRFILSKVNRFVNCFFIKVVFLRYYSNFYAYFCLIHQKILFWESFSKRKSESFYVFPSFPRPAFIFLPNHPQNPFSSLAFFILAMLYWIPTNEKLYT